MSQNFGLIVVFVGDSGKDAITIANGENMIFDHISVSWGRDETFSINGDVSNVTISDSIIAQGLETHSCGGLMQSTGGVSIFRTLYIDNQTRNPKVKGINEFTNNVVRDIQIRCSRLVSSLSWYSRSTTGVVERVTLQEILLDSQRPTLSITCLSGGSSLITVE